MHKSTQMPTSIFILAILLFLTGCGSPPNAQSANTQVQIDELSIDSTAVEEVIHINNCGGKGDAIQIAEHSFGTDIEGVGGGQVGIPVIQGNVSAKYGQYRNVTKSHQLVAPPGTNMEIVLKWSEEIHAGKILVDGVTGTYKARIPIAVEQVSSQDLGCVNTVAPAIEPTEEVLSASTSDPSCMTITPFREMGKNGETKTYIRCPVGQVQYSIQVDDILNSIVLSCANQPDRNITFSKNEARSKNELLNTFDSESFRSEAGCKVKITIINNFAEMGYTVWQEVIGQ